MRILMLSQWFDPEPMAAKGLYFAEELVRRGHDVQVLTGFPNYPEGKVYPGYRVRLCQSEQLGNVPVHRVALYPSHDGSSVRRAANYLSFSASAALIGPWHLRRPDVVYVYNLVTLAPAAGLLRLLHGAPIVYDVQDLWPESVTASGMLAQGRLARALGQWCDGAYRRADHVVTLSPGIAATLVRRGVGEDRVTTIYNWCDERAIHPCPRDPALAERLGLADGFSVMFAGNMGLAQALDAVLEAAARLAEGYPRIRFVFVGGGVERGHLEAVARERGLANVVFLPRQPMEAMGPILALADALLVHLKDDPLFRITIPSKVQAYLAAGVPLILGVRGDAEDVVMRSGGGVICQPGDPSSIADAVLRLYSLPADERAAMGSAGREFYERELSFRVGVDRFEDCFRRVVARRKASRR